MASTKEGAVTARVILQIVGKPKEHITEALDFIIQNVRDDAKYTILRKDIQPIEEREGLFTIFAELEISSKSFEDVVWFCFDYMPASVEILEPRELQYKADRFTSFLNELQARIHTIDLALKASTQKNNILHRNAAGLFRNLVRATTKTPKTASTLSKETGIVEEQLKDLLQELIQKKLVRFEQDRYSWIQ